MRASGSHCVFRFGGAPGSAALMGLFDVRSHINPKCFSRKAFGIGPLGCRTTLATFTLLDTISRAYRTRPS